MAGTGNIAGARPFGPPLVRGLPILVLCGLGLAYAGLAIPAALFPASGLHTRLGGTVGGDFLAFYSAASLAWGRAASEVYNLTHLFNLEAAISGIALRTPCPYPPVFLLYAAPLAAIPYLPALYLWLFASTSPFALVTRRLSGLALPLIALSPPVIQNAIDGQNGALTASLFAVGLSLLTGGRPVLAGISFAFLSYKPQTFLLIPVCLIAAREYRALVAAAAAGAVLWITSLAVFGVETWWSFLSVVSQQMSFVLNGQEPTARFPTVFVLVLDLIGNAPLAKAAQGLSTLACFALVAWCWRRTTAILPRALVFAAALPLSTPYMLEYDLAVWALPAAILMVRLWRGEGELPDWVGLVLLWASPPMIFLLSRVDFHFSAGFPLALAAYAVWRVREEPAGALEPRFAAARN
jgi:hypothetical protein